MRVDLSWTVCHEDVTRKGVSQPCDLPAVAVRLDPETEDGYPVCVRHTRAPMVHLPGLVVAIRGEG